MSLSLTLECRHGGCTRAMRYHPAKFTPESVAMRYNELVYEAGKDGWDVTEHLCPEHARSSLEKFLRSTMAPLPPTLDSVKDIAKALEYCYLPIPKDDVIDNTIERSDFYAGPTMTVRYKQSR
jgi:hypothetical protein